MELRSAGILGCCIVGLAAALLIPVIQSSVLFVMALVPLALLVFGQINLPRSRRSFRIWFDPIIIDLGDEVISLEPGTPLGRLSGREIIYSSFKQWHDFEIVTHRFWLLAAIGLLSLASVWLSLRGPFDFVTGTGYYYFLVFFWTLMVTMAKRWLWERRMLRLKGVSMATFSVTGRNIRYHFVDPDGRYRGGLFESLVCSRTDYWTIVFYDEKDPDRSVPAAGLMFHVLVWKPSHSSALASGSSAAG